MITSPDVFRLTTTTFPYTAIAGRLMIALAAGLLVGLEREWAQKEVGVRTFSIAALLGAMTSVLSPALLFGAVLGILLLICFLNVQSLLKDRSLELTTSIALLATLILGAMAGAGHYFTTAMAAILLTMLLAWKLELARFADALKPEEIRGAALLGLLSFVIYPLLPDRFVDPWLLVNPQRAWVTVMVIAGIGFVNYVLLRLYSERGLYYVALLGGLVNSTAVVAELSAAFAALPTAKAGRAVGILLLTNVAMFVRNAVILAIFAPTATLVTAAVPLGVMAGSALVAAWWREGAATTAAQLADGGGSGPPRAQAMRLSSPVSLPRVLKFGVLFLAIAIVGTLAQRLFGSAGFLVVSAIGGAISSASTTASAASLAATGEVDPATAGIAAVVTSIASMLVNMPLVYQQTRQPALTRRLAIASLIIAVLGASSLPVGWVVLARMSRARLSAQQSAAAPPTLP